MTLGLATAITLTACGPVTDDHRTSSTTHTAAPRATEDDEVEGNPSVPPTVTGSVPIPQPIRLQYPVPGGVGDPNQNIGDLYLPSGVGGPVPVVVLLHGGGWRVPASYKAMSSMARSLVSHGVAVWNVEYRRIGAGGGYPTTLTDTAAAIDYLQTIKAQIAPAIDLDDVVISGHSAGGQLAVWAAAREMLTPGAMGSVPAVRPAAIVATAGVLDMRVAVADGNRHTREFLGDPEKNPQNYAVANPIQNINPAVPVTCFNGTRDSVVRAHECTRFISALKSDGGVGRAVLLPGAGHNVYSPSNPYWPQVQNAILDYVDDFRSAPSTSTPGSTTATKPREHLTQNSVPTREANPVLAAPGPRGTITAPVG